jgi:hypothetical protein
MRLRGGLLIVAVLLLPVGALAQDKAQRPLYPMPPPVSPPVTVGEGGDVNAVRDVLVDRAIRCLRYAASIGVPRDRMDQYLRDCELF